MTDADSVESPHGYDFNHTTAGAELYAELAEQRQKCPVIHGSSFGGFWTLLNHQDVAQAANDPVHFTSTKGTSLPALGLPTGSIPATADPPQHTKYRRIIQPEFMASAIRAFEPQIRKIMRDQIATFSSRGHADVMTELANPVPPMVIAMILGMEQDRWKDIRTWTQQIVSRSNAGQAATGAPPNQALQAYIMSQIADRRARPRPDLLTTIVTAEVDGAPLEDHLVYGMVQQIVIAGHETTVSGIGNILHYVLRYPKIRERVLSDPAFLDKVIEESLRIEAPVFGLARTVATDITVCGQPMAVGEKVLLAWGAANHDPNLFSEPATFDPGRPNLQRHLAFGYGRHRCVGEHLARLELRLAVEEMLGGLADLRLSATGIEISGGNLRGPKALPVEWTVG
jgi:cytochrome P450